MQEYIVKVYKEGESCLKEEWRDRKSGKRHRIGGPAATYWIGYQYYYINGELHREDGPAVIYSDGTQFYYKNGELHREDGPAVIYSDGYQLYYINGELHREDGPAVIYADGYQYYYKNGELHREDGPAVIYSDGSEYYCLEGVYYSKEEFLKKTKKHKISIDGKEIEISGESYEALKASLNKEDKEKEITLVKTFSGKKIHAAKNEVELYCGLGRLKEDTVSTGTTDDVTCKNCLKHLK